MLRLQPIVLPLDCVRNQPEVIPAIVSACQWGQVEAENRPRSNRPRIYRGTEAYFETIEALCSSLMPLGFERQEKQNQVRLLSPVRDGEEQYRLLACRGKVVGSNITVNPKGYLTQKLVNEDNWHYVPHLSIFPTEELPPKNIWVIYDNERLPEGDIILTVTLAMPYPLTHSGTLFECQDTETLYCGPLVQYTASLEDVPEGVSIEVVINENTGTDS